MQRRTNEWYQGLREASSEEEEEEVILELETTFGSPSSLHLKDSPAAVKWKGNSSKKSTPQLRNSGCGFMDTKSSPTPPLWTDVRLECGEGTGSSIRSSGSNSSNSELGVVRDRTTSRSPPSLDDVAGGGGLLSSSS